MEADAAERTVKLTSVIEQSAENLLPLQTFVARAIAGLSQAEIDRDLLLALAQELHVVGRVGKPEPRDKGKEAGRHALDDEQDPPWADAALGLRDAVCECGAVRVRRGRAGQEDSRSQAQLLSRVEVRQVARHSRSEGSLEDGQEHSADHDAGPGGACCLKSRDDAPSEDCEGDPAMGWECFPAHLCPL